MFSLGERHEIYMIGSSIAARYLRYTHTPCALARMLFVFLPVADSGFPVSRSSASE